MAYDKSAYGHQFFDHLVCRSNTINHDQFDQSGTWYSIDDSLPVTDLYNARHLPMTSTFDLQILHQSTHNQGQIQTFIHEYQDPYYAGQHNHIQVFGKTNEVLRGTVGIFPGAEFARHPSPVDSQGLSSACNSASPGAESEWDFQLYQGRDSIGSNFDAYKSPTVFATTLPSVEANKCHFKLPQTSNTYVNMSQIQGFSDAEDMFDTPDEGYDEIAIKHGSMKQERTLEDSQPAQVYTSNDSALDMESPSEDVQDDTTSDVDAEGELDEPEVVEDPASAIDAEYTPRSTRTRKARPTHKATSIPKRTANRITKPSHRGNKITCTHCNSTPFKDKTSLLRHIASAHTRAFTCVFSFVGCTSTFASKNEWKRHVSSQHLNLSSWICEQGSCGKSSGNGIVGTEFNRKDLYTQHLHRMHAPHHVKRKKEIDAKWESEIRHLQVSCLKVKREAPQKLACPVAGCGAVFEGRSAWDEKMEHVGKHLEKVGSGAEEGEVDHGRDRFLVNWAVREGIAERVVGGYRVGDGRRGCKVEEDEDEDDDGEDE